MAIFELGGGVVFNYRGSWCASGARTSWESAWRFVGTARHAASGTATTISVPRWRPTSRFPATRSCAIGEPVEVPPLDPSDRIDGHVGIIRDFVAAVRDGGTPETRGEDNIQSLAMVFGAIESAETGRRVPIRVPAATPERAIPA